MSHVGGRIETAGEDLALLSGLEHALRVRSDERATMAHVHGFHSYPARLHPETAARLITGLSRPRDTVLDPFCGSGTVLVEARRLGRRALGIDANPLAVELAWLKARGFDAHERGRIAAAAAVVTAAAEERRLAKAGPTRRYPAIDRELFDVHVLLELDGLRAGIAEVPDSLVRRALFLVLSAVLTKVSRQPGDTVERAVPRRLAGGYTIRLFQQKADELLRRLEQYDALVPERVPRPEIQLGDARVLRPIGRASVDAIVTSPPYPGVYDYHQHHAARMRWLGLAERGFERTEIGARRRAGGRSHAEVLTVWERELGACLAQMARVLRPGARAALVLADTAAENRALRADAILERLAPAAGLALIARASQPRPHFHGPTARAFREAPRREHVLVLRRG